MSDEVSSFLRSVEQLNQRRDEDEEARSRELEEKILQQRRERQARREGTYILGNVLARIALVRCCRAASRPSRCPPARPPYPDVPEGHLYGKVLLALPAGLETSYAQPGLAWLRVFLFLPY